MLKVFIADDEEQVLSGLKKIIPWEKIGFTICGEAMDGESAYNSIMLLEPDLVLLDIRMPKMQGLEVAAQLRTSGYNGKIIILSGYSEFKYAQEAIQCEVDFYLTKPIDEVELEKAVSQIKHRIQKEIIHNKHMAFYQEQAKFKILKDIIQVSEVKHGESLSKVGYALEALNLEADWYQVVILKVEGFSSRTTGGQGLNDGYDYFCRMMNIPNSSRHIEHLVMEDIDVILLKGKRVIDILKSLRTTTFNQRELKCYVSAGRVVDDINDIYYSYHEALAVNERRFFNKSDEVVLDYEVLPNSGALTKYWTIKEIKAYGLAIFEAIEMNKVSQLKHILNQLEQESEILSNSVESIKILLAELFLFIKQSFEKRYPFANDVLPSNTKCITMIQECQYIKDIDEYYKNHFSLMADTIGYSNSDNIIEEILHYISNNYMKDIRLKNVAPKFGYNSSYLGKLFTKKTGESFNEYVHQIRIGHAKEMLADDQIKIYEISKSLGYKNVDYFHRKFKEITSQSPNEYRNKSE